MVVVVDLQEKISAEKNEELDMKKEYGCLLRR
jgi:hypothetical protein